MLDRDFWILPADDFFPLEHEIRDFCDMGFVLAVRFPDSSQ